VPGGQQVACHHPVAPGETLVDITSR
jgi:hypothetical protein